jgi:hypothetical protein
MPAIPVHKIVEVDVLHSRLTTTASCLRLDFRHAARLVVRYVFQQPQSSGLSQGIESRYVRRRCE